MSANSKYIVKPILTCRVRDIKRPEISLLSFRRGKKIRHSCYRTRWIGRSTVNVEKALWSFDLSSLVVGSLFLLYVLFICLDVGFIYRLRKQIWLLRHKSYRSILSDINLFNTLVPILYLNRIIWRQRQHRLFPFHSNSCIRSSYIKFSSGKRRKYFWNEGQQKEKSIYPSHSKVARTLRRYSLGGIRLSVFDSISQYRSTPWSGRNAYLRDDRRGRRKI